MITTWVKRTGRTAGIAVLMALGAAQALAQSSLCDNIASQLNSLDSGGGDQFARAAAIQRGEIAKISAQMQSSGCGTSSESYSCANLSSQLGAMRTNLARMDAQSQRGRSGDQNARRAQLVAAYSQNGCRSSASVSGRPEGQRIAATPQTAYPAEAAPRSGGFFENLFGGLLGGSRPARSSAGYSSDVTTPVQDGEPPLEGGTGLGGSRAVCVRSCDGGYFPASRNDDGGSATCSLMCPGAESQLYFMRGDDISTAVSSTGQAYTRLANAFKYKKAFDKTCTCRPQNASWADLSTRDSDPTLRNGDIVVTELQSKLMSLPADTRKAAEPALREQDRLKREDESKRLAAEGLQAKVMRDINTKRAKGQLRNDRSLALDGEVAAAPLAPATPVVPVAAPAAPIDTAAVDDQPRVVRVIGAGSFTPNSPALRGDQSLRSSTSPVQN